ncbi:MAG: flagellar hook-associated protein FlgK [Rhodocyclaceae bacterium]|nr:flagellar hook-associated protein FlgK [Rhodocyclaceae bacterium]
MSSGLLGVGISGLAAAQLGLVTTEHNITNASTPGYTRQRSVQVSVVGLATGSGSVGQGTNVTTIERMYDKYLTAQVNTAQTRLSETDAYYAQISQIDNMMADPSAGLTPALQSFFSGVQEVAANPSLLSARQSMISSAETLSSRFQALDTRLDELSDEVNGRIVDSVDAINSYAEQIAELNQRIVIAESAFNQPANDMRDQRGQLINELNKLVKVTTPSNTSNGSLNVFIGSGQPLVMDTQAMELTADVSSADSSKVMIGIKTNAGGNSLLLPDSLIVGGELGGLVKFRNEALTSTTNEVGRMAATLALTFNAQQAMGQDLLGRAQGETGFTGEFFATSTLKPTVSANANNVKTDPAIPVVAATISAAFVPPSFGGADGNFYTNLTASDYQLTRTGANYTLTRLNDNKQWTNTDLSALSTTVSAEDGFSFSLSSGAFADGDSFLIQPTKTAAENLAVSSIISADPRTIAAALPFKTETTKTNTGTGAISGGTGIPGANLSLLPVKIDYVFTPAAGALPETRELSFPASLAGQSVTVKLPDGTKSTFNLPGASPVNINYTSGMEIEFSGMKFSMTGAPNNGDSFSLSRNPAASSDSRNALALGKLQTQNTVAGGTSTFQTAYSQTVANVGIKTRELRVIGAAQESGLIEAQTSRDNLSGVNLDEEAANMIRYQQAYQASAKILDIGSTLFDSILALG